MFSFRAASCKYQVLKTCHLQFFFKVQRIVFTTDIEIVAIYSLKKKKKKESDCRALNPWGFKNGLCRGLNTEIFITNRTCHLLKYMYFFVGLNHYSTFMVVTRVISVDDPSYCCYPAWSPVGLYVLSYPRHQRDSQGTGNVNISSGLPSS